jgi:hypothetical protein
MATTRSVGLGDEGKKVEGQKALAGRFDRIFVF